MYNCIPICLHAVLQSIIDGADLFTRARAGVILISLKSLTAMDLAVTHSLQVSEMSQHVIVREHISSWWLGLDGSNPSGGGGWGGEGRKIAACILL